MKKAFSILLTLILVLALLLPTAAAAGIESVSLSTYQAGSTPQYQITYRLTESDLYYAGGDYISVIFPTGTTLPAVIPTSEIQVNTLRARDVRVSQDQNRIDILVPADISSGQTVNILVKQGAGIMNPPSPGRNVISVMNPKALSLSQFIYNITAGSVSRPEVFVSPALSGANARYNIKFYPGTLGDLSGGADTITISFPAGTQIPQAIDSSSITINGYPAKGGSVVKSGLSVTFGLPVQVSAPGLSQVIVDISKSAGILNGPAGSYSLGLSTSRETMVSLSETYTISGGSVSSPRVAVTPPAPGSAAQYQISFNVSSNGDLRGGTDTISITFPQAISLPSTMPGSAITVNGTSLNSGVVSLSGKRITFTVPHSVSVEAEGGVSVKISPEANIKNPLTPGNNYILLVATSRDSVGTASQPYAIAGAEIKDLLVNATPSSVNSLSQYDISFKTSYGTLEGGRDRITLAFPDEAGLPVNISRGNIEVNGVPLDTGIVTMENQSISFYVPSGVFIEPGSTVNVKIKTAAGINNPSRPGTYFLNVSSTKSPDWVKSNGLKIESKKTISLVIDSKTAFIDAKPLSLDVPATILNGRTLVPVRFVSEALGATVKWNQDTQEVTVTLDGKNIVLTVDSDTARVDGRQVILDTSPVIIAGRTLVPIRFLAENFGGQVVWDSETRTVTINK